MKSKTPIIRTATGDRPIKLTASDDDDQLSRIVRQFHLDECRQEIANFRRTGNGVHAWRIFALARIAGVDVPQVVFNYFDACADAVTRNESPAAVLNGMALNNGKGGARAQKAASATDRQIAMLQDLACEYRLMGTEATGRAKTKIEARKRVAIRHDTTHGSLNTLWNKVTKARPKL